MAIQFPPINPGDPEPVSGDTFFYLITQEEFECHRKSQAETAQWSCKGAVNKTSFGYVGTLEIQKPAPQDAEKGNIYSVSDGGIAHSTFIDLAGQNIEQWSLVIYADPGWVLVQSSALSPWIRTSDGRIEPVVKTDDLDMVDGSYLIESLPLIQN